MLYKKIDVNGMKKLLQKMSEQDVAEFAKTQLTLPDKIDPADEMSWQHYLYSKLGSKSKTTVTVETSENKAKIIDDTVERIVAMSKVLFGLHMVSVEMCGFRNIEIDCFILCRFPIFHLSSVYTPEISM